MDAIAWTVVGAAIAILVAIATAFRSLRSEMRLFRGHMDERIDAQGRELRERIDAQGEDLRSRIDAQGEDLRSRIDAQGEDLRARIDAQGEDLRARIDAQGERIDAQGKETGEQIGQLRERMARLEGLLEGLREAVTGKRAA